MVTSGIRLGSAAMTTKGFKEAQMIEVANLINETLENKDNLDKLQQIKERVIQLVKKYQIY
jgi:glycine hydroxymethyltransferase